MNILISCRQLRTFDASLAWKNHNEMKDFEKEKKSIKLRMHCRFLQNQ
jgi:hypothetical protein